MILPSKHLSPERALLSVGGHILTCLSRPKTVSAVWEELNRPNKSLTAGCPRKISYDWFLLALDLLYALGAISFKSGLLARRTA